MSEQKSLIEFPLDFDIKVMGTQHKDFKEEILKAVLPYAPNTTESNITMRESSQGNYLSATVTVYAENQEQLDNIYRSLTAHHLVKVVF